MKIIGIQYQVPSPLMCLILDINSTARHRKRISFLLKLIPFICNFFMFSILNNFF